ncbi:hypothetical protein JOQ06_004556, partial [Pogonophryne albipinna]
AGPVTCAWRGHRTASELLSASHLCHVRGPPPTGNNVSSHVASTCHGLHPPARKLWSCGLRVPVDFGLDVRPSWRRSQALLARQATLRSFSDKTGTDFGRQSLSMT